MSPQSSWVAVAGGTAAVFSAMTGLAPRVDGHMYVMAPVSRQYHNSQVFQDQDFPGLEKCPQCYNAMGEVPTRERGAALTDPELLKEYGDGWWPFNAVFDKGEMAPNGNYIEPQGISVRHGVCGDPKQATSEGTNTYSTPNSRWEPLADYEEGSVMEIKAVMGAYHWGHLEFFICNAADLADPSGVATQECFNMHPLTRAAGDDVNSPIDPNYPGRYYVDPECREFETDQTKDIRSAGGYVMTMNYQLPAGLTCTHCTLQMINYTGHKCRHHGYEEFNPPSWPGECAPNKEDWIDLNPPKCGEEKWNYAEQFWGCSDFSISGGGSSPTPETPATTPVPTTATASSTAAPIAAEMPSPMPTEGGGGAQCDEPVEPYEQCGGDEYVGSTCCTTDYKCVSMGACFSECRPTSEENFGT